MPTCEWSDDRRAAVVIGEADRAVFDRAARALLRGPVIYEPIYARDGVRAYKAIQVIRPAAARIAADLPGIDGASIIGALGRSPIHRERLFVGLAGEADEAGARRLIESGARAVLLKEFAEDDLRLVLDARLGAAAAAPPQGAPLLLVCADDAYRAALASALAGNGDEHVGCASVAVFAIARARCERPRAVILVEPVIGLDARAFLVRLRREGIDAPVLLIGEPPEECPGLRYLGRRRAPDESWKRLWGELESGCEPSDLVDF